jgi:hypothetical protein
MLSTWQLYRIVGGWDKFEYVASIGISNQPKQYSKILLSNKGPS